MKKLFLFLLPLGALYSCISDDFPEPAAPPLDAMVQVTLPIQVSGQELITRAAAENDIADVNLYLVADRTVLRHVYANSARVSFQCPVGHYDLYVIANHHADMGEQDFDRLASYTLRSREDYDNLPMTAVERLEITASEQAQTLPAIEVKRAVAKLNYTITVAPAVRDIEIKSVQVIHRPRSFVPFGDGRPDTATNAYDDGPIVQNTGETFRTAGSLYLLPNMQGRVPGITVPERKNEHHAPAMATCLRIRALRANKVLDYTIYLGENDTSDFNVRANTAHTLNITIRNDNAADVRIKSYTVDVVNTIGAEPENGIYLQTAPIVLSVEVSGDIPQAGLRCRLLVNKGDTNVFAINGKQGQQQYELPISMAPNSNSYVINYTPPTFDPPSVMLDYTLDFYDKDGIVYSCDFRYCFANVVKVYSRWYNGSKGDGELWSPDALHWVKDHSLSSTFYLFYCSDAGCTLVAEPDSGHVFDGWFRGHNATGSLGGEDHLLYRPVSDDDTIYAYFR